MLNLKSKSRPADIHPSRSFLRTSDGNGEFTPVIRGSKGLIYVERITYECRKFDGIPDMERLGWNSPQAQARNTVVGHRFAGGPIVDHEHDESSYISMNLDLAKVLTTVGPAASIIFAAWIFVAFLQTRYDAAVERYRDLIEKFRTSTFLEAERQTCRTRSSITNAVAS
jgi:hypothetical protein